MDVLQDYFTHLPTQQLLICNTCKFAVSRTNFSQHLRRYHGEKKRAVIPLTIRQRLTLALSTSTLTLRDESEVPIPTTAISALSCLTIVNGYRCLICQYLAGTEDSIRQHCYFHTRTKSITSSTQSLN